jgi:predicted transcriptional regulator
VLRPTAKKNATITVRVDEATKTALERFATEDDRKLSAYCARVLKAHVEAKLATQSEAAGEKNK